MSFSVILGLGSAGFIFVLLVMLLQSTRRGVRAEDRVQQLEKERDEYLEVQKIRKSVGEMPIDDALNGDW